MCFGPAPIPPTQKAANYQKAILIVMFILFIVVILNFVAVKFIVTGLFGLMLLLILYMGQRQMSHQMLMIFIFFSIYFCVLFMVQFLTPIQNGDDISQYSTSKTIQFVVAIISFAFYLFASIFLFFPYRQFKTIAFSQNPALHAYFNNNDDQPQALQQARKKPENQETVNYNVDYGNIDYDKNKKNKDKGTFQVFKGQGLRIG